MNLDEALSPELVPSSLLRLPILPVPKMLEEEKEDDVQLIEPAIKKKKQKEIIQEQKEIIQEQKEIIKELMKKINILEKKYLLLVHYHKKLHQARFHRRYPKKIKIKRSLKEEVLQFCG